MLRPNCCVRADGFACLVRSNWIKNIKQHASENVRKILLGNKCDVEEKRAISTERGQALADEYGIQFYETSAKSGKNVEEAFFTLAKDIRNRQQSDAAKGAAATAGKIKLNSDNAKKAAPGAAAKGCC